MRYHLTFLFIFFIHVGFAQYAPGVGLGGTTAIYKDSSAFVSWASQSTVVRGPQQINDLSYGYASVGDNISATDKAGLNGVVSLGDGGFATLQFNKPITNGAGYDFAVFENALNDQFLELAFVEISSDGINYFRFPASSLTDQTAQTGSFSATDPTKINNLAGKYRADYGTPFDLQELSNISGLNIDSVSYIKVIDVVGTISENYATHDSQGRKVNDPWPTPYPSSGFDLDAVGVIHELATSGINSHASINKQLVYPNPVKAGETLHAFSENDVIEIKSSSGLLVGRMDSSEMPAYLSPGIYFVQSNLNHNSITQKLVVLE